MHSRANVASRNSQPGSKMNTFQAPNASNNLRWRVGYETVIFISCYKHQIKKAAI